MREYRERVRRAAQERGGDPIYNGSVEHASILAEQLFKSAVVSVDLLTGSLDARVYGRPEVLQEAEAFLSKPNRKVRILLEEPECIDVEEHPFFKSFRSRTDVEFRVLPKAISEATHYHFMVMDSDSYRFEEDKTKPEAVAAFGHSEGGKKLTSVFSLLWESGTPYEAAN